MAWLAPDKLKAVRLLGRHSIDALDSMEAARIYLASNVLLNQGGDPFQEILNDLSADEAPVFVRYMQQRGYAELAPVDAAAARQLLLELVDQATGRLRQKAEILRELAELDAAYAADRLSWDDTAEGESLRRYEMTCNRTLLRMFELLLKVRRTGEELDLGTIASQSRSATSGRIDAIDTRKPANTTVIAPPRQRATGRIARSKPIRIEKARQTNPILVFRKSDLQFGTGTKSSELIRRISTAKPAKSG